MTSTTLDSGIDIPLLRTLDIHLTEIGERSAVMEVLVTEKHLNYSGGAHGGLLAALIDTVCFFPKPLLPSGRVVTTTNLSVNYVRPAQLGERLRARSEILHLGRRTVSLTARIHNGAGELVAHGSVTLMVLQNP
jgi:acyl-CoA thioesterase